MVVVNAKFAPKVDGDFFLVGFEGNAGGIGDPHHGVEDRGERGAIDDRTLTHGFRNAFPDFSQPHPIPRDQDVGKLDEQGRMWNSARGQFFAVDALESEFPAFEFAARTEQYRMAGGSVDALIEGGHPRRQQFDLRVRDVPVLNPELT